MDRLCITVILFMFICVGISYSRTRRNDRKEKPTCTKPKVENWGNSSVSDYRIVMNCALTRLVTNKPTCNYFWKKVSEDSQDESEPKKITTNTKIELEDTLRITDFKGTCNLFMRVSALEHGSYRFECHFPANDNDFEKYVSPNVIKLRKPRIRLADCPKGDAVQENYIRVNTNASCKCELEDEGNPPGRVQWENTSSNLYIGNPSSQSAILNVFYDGKQKKTTYLCRGKSTDKIEMTLSYTPQFAYGPTKIQPLPEMEKRVVSLCMKPKNMPLICDVHTAWFHPDVDVVVEGFGNEAITATNIQKINGYKRFTFYLSVTNGGSFTPKFVGFNKRFPEIRKEKDTVLEVREPPSAPPTLSVNDENPVVNGTTVKVYAGRSIKVTCLVKGGNPQVSEIELKIAKLPPSSTLDSQYSKIFNVTKDMDKQVVECSAGHVTKCYNKKTSFIFNVLYGAEIRMFAVNDFSQLFKNQTSEVGVDSVLGLQCLATGKPKPDIRIRNKLGEVGYQSVNSFGNSVTVNYTKKVSCKDTGRYTCTAENEIDLPASEDVLILVKCPLELKNDDEKHIYKTTINANVNVVFNILGYPKPTQHALYKIVAHSDEQEEPRIIEPHEGRYNITFWKVDEHNNIADLTVYMVGSGDAGKYRLDIGNGIGQDLNTTFKIILGNSETSDGGPPFLIIGIACGVALIIIVVVISVILVRRHLNKKNDSSKMRGHGTSGYIDDGQGVTLDNVIYGSKANTNDDNNEGVTLDNVIYGSKPNTNDDNNEVTIVNTVYGMSANVVPDNGGCDPNKQYQWLSREKTPNNECEYMEIDPNLEKDNTYSNMEI